MIEANDHLKKTNLHLTHRNRKSNVYDSSKISVLSEQSKKIPDDMVVGIQTIHSYRKDTILGIVNFRDLMRRGSYGRGGSEPYVTTTGYTDNRKEVKSQLNKRNLRLPTSSKGNASFPHSQIDSPILKATCEISGEVLPVQTHEWVTDSFNFRDYIEGNQDDPLYRDMLSDDKATRRKAFTSLFEIELEEGEGYTGRGDEKVQYVKKFKVIPSMTPYLSDEQRAWIESQIDTKTVKSKGIKQSSLRDLNTLLGGLWGGQHRYGASDPSWFGIPALVKISPNMVAVSHIVDSTYDEKNDTISHAYDHQIVKKEYVQDMKNKKSPNYQRFIIDRKVANEKALGVKDLHRNACKICGKRDHNSKNCNIWSYNAQPLKEAWEAGVGFGKGMDLEFTVFKSPIMLDRKNTRYGPSTLVKTRLYVADSRKPVATLVLWGDSADDYLDWMNGQTLGEGWAKSQDKWEDIQRWYRQHGGVDSLTHDRLILKAKNAWVKRPKYKNKEAWAVEVGINTRHGAYLEYTGENYRFIPKDKRKELDDMYERVTVSKPVMIVE